MPPSDTIPPITEDSIRNDVVDPLIRAHIYSLCTALGGASTDEPGTYTLGDDALACLKDLRRWLKLYDEKLSRYDVARCLSEMNLLKGDLLEIIAMWKEEHTHVKPKHRLVVACIELIAPLTWPLNRQSDQMTVNHHRHIPVLRHAQAGYKAAILQHRSGKILKDIIRAGLPAMALPALERSEREEGIIKLILYVLRNIAIIEDSEVEEINRSATVHAYAAQNVFDLLLTVASGVADEFRVQDTVVMEAVYHLVKGVDVESVFRSEKQENEKRGKDLTQLLKMEDDMRRNNSSGKATRHNRFGTTIWMERNDGTRSFVSGQDALLGKASGLEKLDKSKKWKKPRGGDIKGVSRKTDFDLEVPLDAAAKTHIRKFVEDFIDAGFNPLFLAIRQAIDRDVERLLDTHVRQYFYLVAWFLEAERVRRRNAAKERKAKGLPSTDEDSFAVVAAVLNQEFLVCLNKKMTEWFDLKQWTELQAGMRCFTQILYTVQDMALSPIEDDQEISENIQNRLFYEESTMDLIYNICRSYTKQPFRWLDDCIEMVHVHLKLLEKYSQQHEHMFVRSRRRQTKKAAQKAQELGEESVEREEDEAELAAASKRALTERAFDFKKFEGKYLNHSCINTFISYLSFYKELSEAQVMRAIKMLHRIFEKRKMEVLLYRLDLVDLLYQMMQGSQAMPRSHPAYKQVDQFAKHFLRKLFKKLEAEPALYVELLFTKSSATLHYLQFGEEKEVHVSRPRAAAELHVKPSAKLSHAEQIGVAVAVLLDDNNSGEVEWLKDVLKRAFNERKAWEDEATARRGEEGELYAEMGAPKHIYIDPGNDDRKKAMFKDAHLRLLLKLVGAEPADRDETPDTKWIFPAETPAETMGQHLASLQRYANDPPTYEDGVAAADLLARKNLLPPRSRRTDALSSDSSDDDADDDEHLFAPGGPTPRSPSYKKEKKKGTRKRRPKVDAEDALADLQREKREKRLAAEKAKLAKIKSEMYVRDSDEEDDEEKDRLFFEREREIRRMGPRAIDEPPMLNGKGRKVVISDDEDVLEAPKKRRRIEGKKAKLSEPTSIFGGDDSEGESGSDSGTPPRRKSSAVVVVSSEDESESEKDESEKDVVMIDEDEDDDEEDVPVPTAKRRKPVIVDSDDDDDE